MDKTNTEIQDDAKQDIQLMSRLKEGDESAMRPLMDRHMPWVYKLAYRMCRSAEEAQDITQEVFLKVWKVRDTWQPKAKLSTWIYRVATNVCIDRIRKPSLATIDGDIIEETVMGVDGRKIVDDLSHAKVIWRAVDQLPARQRAAFVLCQYEGHSMKEAAEIMDVTVASIESLLVRSKKMLRRVLLPLAEDKLGITPEDEREDKPTKGLKTVAEKGGVEAPLSEKNGTDHEV